MDIYQQANEQPNADYYDWHTGYIYCIQEYTEAIKTNPNAKIRVIDSLSGETIGYASKKMS